MFISSTEIIPYYRVCKKVVVKVSNLEHNHRIGSDLMAHYPLSLAYAYTLCQGEDPVEIQYDVLKMRPHFLSCLQKKEFTVFPSVKTRHTLCKAIMTSFKIYCLCQLPERQGDKMVACDQC